MSKNTTLLKTATKENNSHIFDQIVFKLSAKKKSGRWQAHCPCHDDQTASLSLTQKEDGHILLKCFAGCETRSIVEAIGFSMADLFPEDAATKGRSIKAVYDYKDETGNLLYQSIRYEPKSFTQRRPDGQGGWIYNLKGIRRVLYRLPELLKADRAATVFICEGEKDVDRLIDADLVSTTNPMGAGKWHDDYSKILEGREIVIIPDNDQAGKDHAENVAKSLKPHASSIKILSIPGLTEKGDISNWFDAGGDAERLCVLAEQSPEWIPSPQEDTQDKTNSKSKSKSRKADIIDLALGHASFFHDEDNKHYASVKIGSRIETYPIESKNFRIWLAGIYFEAEGQPLYGESLKEAIATLQAIAQYQGESRNVFLRLAEHADNIYLDLCDSEWRVVEITKAGWKILQSEESPVIFIRRPAMLSLPEPIAGGTVDELRDFLNVEDDATWALILSWLLMTFHPHGPYPILNVCGEQGSAKTTACKIIRSLIDPNRADLRAVPKEERDLMIAASNSWVLGYDNLSGISQELSDSLCRIATGTGFATRTLHTDSEETIFSVKRPVITNGIIETSNFPDLLDRTISVFLLSIPDEKRREERELWPAFNQAKPRILGAILSAVSHALSRVKNIELTRRPRMADFARWAIAAEVGLNLERDSFINAYDSNRTATDDLVLDTSPAIELKEFLLSLGEKEWMGTATELYKALTTWLVEKGEDPNRKRDWPKQANHLSGKLRRIAPNFRRLGIDINCGRTNVGSCIKITVSN